MDWKHKQEPEQEGKLALTQALIMKKRVTEKEDGRYLIYYDFETQNFPVEDLPYEQGGGSKENVVIQKEQKDKSPIEGDEGIV